LVAEIFEIIKIVRFWYFSGDSDAIEIPLTQGNPDPYLDNYLDLNIKIERSRFLFKILKVEDFNFKVVSFPFLKSNIHSAIGYNAFLSQLVHIGRVCSRKIYFISRSKFIFDKLLDRGFSFCMRKKAFSQYCVKYPEILSAYGVTKSSNLFNPITQ
jgi:hypothetical protein